MPGATSTPPISAIPPDAGLPPREAPGADAGPRTGDDLIAAAAEGESLSGREQRDLLDYFLTNNGLPGDDDPFPLEWTAGEGKSKVVNVWKCRRIEWDEWKWAVDHTTDEKSGDRDTYATASYIVARALLEPKLGPVVARQVDEAKQSTDKKIAGPKGTRIDPPADSGVLLQRMFAKQSGVLFSLSAEVLRLSKLQEDSGSVRTLDQEVEAGKP